MMCCMVPNLRFDYWELSSARLRRVTRTVAATTVTKKDFNGNAIKKKEIVVVKIERLQEYFVRTSIECQLIDRNIYKYYICFVELIEESTIDGFMYKKVK